MPSEKQLANLWKQHAKEWRDPAQITSQYREANLLDKKLLNFRVQGNWWEILNKLGITLLVTREYEHLVMAMTHDGQKPNSSFQVIPHPSGIAVDHQEGKVHIASTRNPNQIYDFEPASSQLARHEVKTKLTSGSPLLPVKSHFYPGCMYFHDLALINGQLYANAVAHNAIIQLTSNGIYNYVWWPRCIDGDSDPIFNMNYLQLNSIAAGKTINESFFTASTDSISRRRPGHKNFPVDKRGVIFSGHTREALVRGLTRPHSARLHQEKLWVNNSGYGEFGVCDQEKFIPCTKLQGWTRGLCMIENIAFVGTSRIIPGYYQYAPGVKPESSCCGVHAINLETGEIMASLVWPYGNQIFAIDWMPSSMSSGFTFQALGKREKAREINLFYSFKTKSVQCN